MATDKKTLLRDALKQVQSGKIDKAIETYKAVAKADPRDATVKNTLGDLYIKQGKKQEGIAAYLEASVLYENDGFAMRSIAICQKVANLDPTLLPVRIKLGDLYAGLKLPAEARAQYLQAADASDKKGDVATALDIFRKLADLDPGNLPVRVKLGGMFEKQKQPEKAAQEYVRAAKGFTEKKDLNTAAQLCVRAFKISPSNTEARAWLADHYAQRQEWSVVVGLLETPVKKGSRDTDLLLRYAEALTLVNHAMEAVNILEPVLERESGSIPVSLWLGRAYLKTGEIEKGTAALGRCVAAHLTENRLEPAEALLREMAAAAPEDDKILQRLLEVAEKRGDRGAVAEAHFRLADLYEKKGLVRAATGIIEKYLVAQPEDDRARRRLSALLALTPAPKVEAPPQPEPRPPPPSTVHAEEGVEIDLEGEDFATVEIPAGEEEFSLEVEGEEAEEAEAPVAEPTCVADARGLIRQGAAMKASAFLEDCLGANPGDVEAWQVLIEARRYLEDRTGLRDAFLRLADLHRRAQRFEEARAAFEGALGVDPRSTVAVRGLADLLVEEETLAPSAPLEPPPPPGEEEEFTLDFSDELEELEAPAEPAAAQPVAAPPAPGAQDEVALDFSEELEELEELEAPAEPAAAQPVAAPPSPGAQDEVALDFSEELEEFEALEAPAEPAAAQPVAAPPSPGAQDEVALDFLEEFEAPAEPAAPQAAIAPEPPVEPAVVDLGDFPGFEGFLPEVPASTTPAAEGPLPSRGEVEEFMAEADFYLQQGLVDEAEFLYTKLLRIVPDNQEIAAQLRKIEELRGPGPAASAPEESGSFDEQVEKAFEAAETVPEAAPITAAALDGGAADFNDFLSGLRQELETEVADSLQSSPPQEQGEEGLADIFQEFQRSVKEQLGDEDFETHYNLGIAYKEMGLTNEAIAEFTLAEKSPVRRLNAVSMIALCLRETGRFDEAAVKLRTGISLATEGSEEQKGFLYDLASLHEQAGRAEEAQETLSRLVAIDPGYRDAAARVHPVQPPAATPRSKKSKVSYL